MNWYLDVLKKYAVFTGRARRKEFWMFSFIVFAIDVVLMVIDGVIGTGGILYMIHVLATLVPSIAVAVRRLHDIGKNGWWVLISLVPLVGAIVLLVFLCKDSQPESNEYGANPKLANA